MDIQTLCVNSMWNATAACAIQNTHTHQTLWNISAYVYTLKNSRTRGFCILIVQCTDYLSLLPQSSAHDYYAKRKEKKKTKLLLS